MENKKCNPNNQWIFFIDTRYGNLVFIDRYNINNTQLILGLVFHLN